MSLLAASASARPFNFTFMRQFSASWPLFDNDYIFRQISVWILEKLQITRDEFELLCRSFEHPWQEEGALALFQTSDCLLQYFSLQLLEDRTIPVQ